jgi:magnesium chelatase family protein
LADRIDLKIEVPALAVEEFGQSASGETSAVMRGRVEFARALQVSRQGCANALMGVKQTEKFCRPCGKGEALLRQAIEKLSLSARAYHRILRVARSIADLASCEGIAPVHLAEAIQYRRLDTAF